MTASSRSTEHTIVLPDYPVTQTIFLEQASFFNILLFPSFEKTSRMLGIG
ncbi:MAG: hypothetical protein HOB18_08720 [Nitrospina sp.]|jgi:hypothetical protein|nr:hypothetical protein [Nitrospina sp.]